MASEGHSPLDQFRIEEIISLELPNGVDLSFTNSSLWMTLSVMSICVSFFFATRRRALVPSYAQLIAESIYKVVADMVRDNIGKEGKRFFPFIFSLFMFILVGNVAGLLPGSFTFTSHLAVNFFLAGSIFLAVTLLGIARHGQGFLRLFLPHGTPWFLAPLLVPIELLSYVSRPVSLSVRLFANMVVGHVLLKVIAGFVVSLGLLGIVPFVGLLAITALELLVAFIQAYVFAILTCIYLHDALYLH